MRVTVPSRMLWSAIIVLILAAMVDSFLLARSYIARNADTVVIVATLLTPTVDPNTGRRYEPVGRLRYTGAQATAIKRVFDGDALNPGAYSASSSNPSIFTPPIYQYTLISTLRRDDRRDPTQGECLVLDIECPGYSGTDLWGLQWRPVQRPDRGNQRLADKPRSADAS